MRIRPNLNLNSIFDIDAFFLEACEIQAILFDLDSTVMKSKSGKFEQKTLDFLKYLRRHFKIAIISNNYDEEYIKKAASQVDFPVVGAARKPDTKVLLKTCEQMRVSPQFCAFVGDRPLTDILCAKRAGMFSILVDSISKDEEKPIVRMVRKLERLAIKK